MKMYAPGEGFLSWMWNDNSQQQVSGVFFAPLLRCERRQSMNKSSYRVWRGVVRR